MLYYLNKIISFGGLHMTNKTSHYIRRIYNIAVSLSTVAAGICLMAACYGIYSTGDHPFSREVVAAAFSPIAPVIYLCLGLVIFGFILELALPESDVKTRPKKNLALQLKRQAEKADLAAGDEALRNSIATQRRSRRLHRIVTAVLLVIGSAIFLSYALDSSHFHQTDINGSMIRAMRYLIPCMGIPCCYGIFAAYHNAAGMRKEIDLLKRCPRAEKQVEKAAPVAAKWPMLLRSCLLIAGIALLVYGFCTGGTADVLTKAVNICTECIGLG